MSLTFVFTLLLAAAQPSADRGVKCAIQTGLCAPAPGEIAAVAASGECVWRALGPSVQQEMTKTTLTQGSRFVGAVFKRHPELEAPAHVCMAETAADVRTFLLISAGRMMQETTAAGLRTAGISEAKLEQAWAQAATAHPVVQATAEVLADGTRTPSPWDRPDSQALSSLAPLLAALGYDRPGDWTPGTPQRLAFEYFVGQELQTLTIARFSAPKPMGPVSLPPAPPPRPPKP